MSPQSSTTSPDLPDRQPHIPVVLRILLAEVQASALSAREAEDLYPQLLALAERALDLCGQLDRSVSKGSDQSPAGRLAGSHIPALVRIADLAVDLEHLAERYGIHA
jgi:hypothetical protein